jgi:hypothetical protein
MSLLRSVRPSGNALALIPHALETRALFGGNRVSGVQLIHDGALHTVTAQGLCKTPGSSSIEAVTIVVCLRPTANFPAH